MIRFSLDLELNTDGGGQTEDIIQIGYTAFNCVTGEILETSGDYIAIPKPLYPFITKLTGITQQEIDTRGVSIDQSYLNLVEFCKKNGVNFGQMVTWGSGDLIQYKNAVEKTNQEWIFGRAEFNLKAFYQAYRSVNDSNYKGGLKTCMKKCNVPWQVYMDDLPSGKKKQRTAHDARCDALNTALFYIHLVSKLKEK